MIMQHNHRPRTAVRRAVVAAAAFMGASLVALGPSCRAQEAPQTAVTPVKVVKAGDGWRLLRGGQPYFIKGAGGSASRALLAQCGGNSIRTWGADRLKTDCEDAAKYGLTVTAGIWLGHKEQGFNYDDDNAVRGQFENAKAIVERYKNTPNLLIWALGNEMDGYSDKTDPRVWAAVEDLARMVHSIDPNHPTMTVIAEIGGDRVASINKYCPDIDIVGINSYGGVTSIPQRYAAAGGVKPYVITEFGPAGTWEIGKNSWGAAPELTSTQKAKVYYDGYERAITNQANCLGGYAFTWGFKQEATATWYGMILPNGDRLGAVDAMQTAWTGKPPATPCPAIDSLGVDGSDSVEAGASVKADVAVRSPIGDPLQTTWKLVYDPVSYHVGGAEEMAAREFPDAVQSASQTGAVIKMPPYKGAYRLYVYVYDRHHGAAVGNIPLFVPKGDGPLAPAAKKAALPFTLIGGAAPSDNYVASGWMGNAGAIKMDSDSGVSGHSGGTCLEVTYGRGDGWGGVVWQSPANDWGDQAGGYDLTGAKRLTFWARGAIGGESVSFSFGLIKGDKPFHDSGSGSLDHVNLTSDWKQYSIDLSGKDLSDIKTGFAWVAAASGQPVRFYLDDVVYE